MDTKFSIRDSLFSHAFSSSNWFKPKYFEWDFKNLHGDFVFFTDRNVHEVHNEEYSSFKKYAWLVESPVITPKCYDYVKQNSTLFDKIFTHSEEIIELFDNAVLLPIGGCHIDEDEISLEYEKDRLVSMMYSNKNFVPGHALRHDVAKELSSHIDIMGSGVTGNHVKKINSCKEYAFSVSIENCREGYYFTEKIVDCFLSGCIPIYWGSPHIRQFFNEDGFIIFDTIDELRDIVMDKNYLIDFYTNHMNEIFENFEKALEYKVAEDVLYLEYGDVL